jgi:hypothetical protein
MLEERRKQFENEASDKEGSDDDDSEWSFD